MNIVLRPQQIVFENAIRDAFCRVRCVLGTAPTGFGKGVVIADMAFKAAEKRRDVLVVTNRRIIVTQLQEQCSKAGIHSGIIMGSVESDKDATVQIGTIQTLTRRGFAGLHPGFIIIDEAHQFHDAYKKLIGRFSRVPILGMTATPVGPDGIRIGHFQEIVEPIRNTEVIAAGDLLRVHPYRAPFEPDLSGVNLKTISNDELGERVQVCMVWGDVFKEWEPYQDMQTMVVFPSRAVCNQFRKMAISRGITAKIVDGTTPQKERDETFSEFKETDCQMLLGVDVVREGLDLPIAQCLIDLQPTHQFRIYWQKLGRVKRPHEGQDSAVVIDMAGNLYRHLVHPDHDPPWNEITSEKTIEQAIQQKAGVRCPECGSKDIYSIKGGMYKCEDCKHSWMARRPWVCPMCKQALGPTQKLIDRVCPNCGMRVGVKQTRQIRMQDGRMRTVPANEIILRKKCKANKAQACWDKWRYVAHNYNKKHPEKERDLRWCSVMFKREMGYWPKGLKNCPDEKDSGDWQRTPGDVYPWMK